MNRSKRFFLTTVTRVGVVALISASLLASSASAETGSDVALDGGLVEHTEGWAVANAELHPKGRSVSTLFPHQGQVFAGHGNYGINSGSMPVNDGTDIGAYDPATDAHVTQMDGFTTEEVKVFREIDGALYAPNVDPTTAHADQPYVTNASGSWGYAGEPVKNAIHIYDMAKLGDEWFLFGSGWTATRGQAGTVQAAATIWSSPDGLTDWTVAHQTPENVADYDGYERFYWGATHGDTLYAAATQGTRGALPPIVQYKDGIWSDVPAPSPDGSWLEYVSAQFVFSTDQGIVFANGNRIHFFDGQAFTDVVVADGQYIQTATLGEDGHLYLLTSNGAISQVDLSTRTQVQIWQGTDPVLSSVTAMALMDNTVYFAANALDATSNRMVTLALPEKPKPDVPKRDKPKREKKWQGAHWHKHGKHWHWHWSKHRSHTKKPWTHTKESHAKK